MTVLTADGCVDDVGVLSSDGCCPNPVGQIDRCVLACSFVDLLPSGPLWDEPKAKALDHLRGGSVTQCDILCPPPEEDCQSLVAYAVYAAMVLHNLLGVALWPALRESDPETAVTSIDDWLDRLGWQDCYKTQCRSVLLGTLTPYEIMGVCGPVFCPVDTPADLDCAVKSAIIKALRRAQMGGIKNLCWLNWVIEPLGAVLTPRNAQPCGPAYPGQSCGPCGGAQFTIAAGSVTLPACRDLAFRGDAGAGNTVQAYFDLMDCDKPAGMPGRIWPGVIAAECIVRSLMPVTCPNNIFRDDCGPVAAAAEF